MARFAEASNARIVHALVLGIISKLAISAGFKLASVIFGPDTDIAQGGLPAFVAFAIVAPIQVAIVVFGLSTFGRVSLKELGWNLRSIALDVVLGIAGFFTIFVGMVGIMLAFGVFDFDALVGAIIGPTLSQRLIFIGIGILAAFNEESIFRGYLQPGFIARWGRGPGIFVCALIFDVLHLKFRPPQFLSKLWIGLVFGVLRGRDRSLFAPAIAHALIWAVFGLY